jgi:hypothetical protein
MKTRAAMVRAEGAVAHVDAVTGNGLLACGPLGDGIKFRASHVQRGYRLVVGDRVDFSIAFAGGRAVAQDVRLLTLSPQRRVVAPNFEAAAAVLRAAAVVQAAPRPAITMPVVAPGPVASSLPDERTHVGINVPKWPKPARAQPRPVKASPRRPDRTQTHDKCGHCEKLMVPRVVFGGGSADHSVCPFCGAMHVNFRMDAETTLHRTGMLLGALAAVGTLFVG